MRSLLIAAALASVTSIAGAAPVLAQSAAEARFSAAQDRFDRELAVFKAEFDRYQAARAGRGDDRDDRDDYPRPGYGDPRDDDDDRYEGGYDPARHYREGPNYRERVLAADDRVYRGSDGRYYCRRSDGTTGLIVGAVAGGIFGNVIDGGHSRAAGTLIGGALGALAGRAVEQNNSVRCR